MERASNAGALTVVAAVGTILLPLNSTMVVVALPRIASELGAEVAGAAWLLTAYLIAMASLQPLGGRFGDRSDAAGSCSGRSCTSASCRRSRRWRRTWPR